MTRGRRMMIAASMCSFALLLGAAGSAVVGQEVTQEERPFRIHGEAKLVIDWEQSSMDADGRPFAPWTMTASQLCTEGWCTNSGSGVMYLDTFISEGSGECTMMDGTAIEWDAVEEYGTQHTVITITGGTGRFEEASGGFAFDYTVLNAEMNEEGNPVMVKYNFWGEGSITY